VSGTFAGLPEGASIADDHGDQFRISYVGGAGNDVTLTAIFVSNTPPTANAGGPYSIQEGNSLTLNASASSDPDGDALSYSWTINGQANAANGVNPTLSWQQLQALGIDDSPTSFAVNVSVDDGHGHVVTSQASTLTVADAPLSATAMPLNTVEGSAVLNPVLFATFTDPGGSSSTTAEYSAIITYQNGSGQTYSRSGVVSWLGPDPTTFGVYATLITTFPEEGSYAITVTITDDGGSSAVASGTIAVADGSLTPASIIPLPSPRSSPFGITVGPDGNLWFTEENKIGRLTTSGGLTEYTLPSGRGPTGIATGPDGNLWFTEGAASQIGRMTPAGVVTEFPLMPNSDPIQIALGQDGNLWFTESISSKLGRITPAGAITEYALAPGSFPQGIAAGPDGNVWFTESTGDRIGRVTPAGMVTEFNLPSPYTIPARIVKGLDGNLWFTDEGGYVGRITPAGAIFGPAIAVGLSAFAITADLDGNIWFTEFYGRAIGQITPAGVVTEFSLPSQPGYAAPSIVTGPDGNLWFTDQFSNGVGRFLLHTNPVAASEGQPFTATLASFTDNDPGGAVSDYTATIAWGDGSTSIGTVAPDGNGGFTVTGSHTYAEESASAYAVTVTVTDAGGSTFTLTGTATVADVAPSNLVLTSSAVLINEGGTITLGGSFSDPGTLDMHTVVINWGDGSANTTLNLAAGVLTFSGASHQYLDNPTGQPNGSFPISVTVTDNDGGSGSGSTSVQVTNVAPGNLQLFGNAVFINENQSFTLSGTFTDPGVLDMHTVVITWGDGWGTALNLSAGVLVFGGVSHQYLDNPTGLPSGSFMISVTVTDKDGASSSASTSVQVNNVAPANVQISLSAATINENQSITLGGSFTDPGTLDTHTVSINWGDGSANTTFNLAAGVLAFGGVSHQYLDNPAGQPNGSFPISVTVTDKDGGMGGAFTSVQVNNVAPASVSLTVATLTDAFNVSHDYSGGNVAGTVWDGVLNPANLALGNANLTKPGELTWSSTANSGWENTQDNAPTLYKLVSGDFDASVEITSMTTAAFADGGLIVRAANLGDAGPGEDYVALRYFAAGNFNATRSTDNGVTTNFNYPALDPFLRITRTGSTFTFYTRPNEQVPWVLRDTQVRTDLGALSQLQVGLWFGTFSTNPGTVTFDNFRLGNLPATTTEGQSVMLSGTFTDPGVLDAHTVVINWGDGSANTTFPLSAGVLAFVGVTHQYLDNPAGQPNGSFPISVTVTDKDGGIGSGGTTVQVKNLAPNLTFSLPLIGVPGQPLTFYFGAFDPSPIDQAAGFTYTVNWGDGTPTQSITATPGNGAGVAVEHVYTTAPLTGSVVRTLTLTATDKDGGTSGMFTGSINLQTARMEGNTLAVGGTTGNDTIILTPADAAGDISVKYNGTSLGNFKPTDHILVYCQSGNDTVKLVNSSFGYISVPAFLYGGATGNDTLDARGSTASNVITGGGGNNTIYGGLGRDLLITGLGASQLIAGSADSILIGGWTDYDLSNTAMTYDKKLPALEAIMAEWGSGDSYTTRINDLTNGGGLNGSSRLNTSTVHDNGKVDTLVGTTTTALDWFFAGTSDVVKNKTSGEVQTAIF
jgi:streptogramin lyase